MKIIKTSEYPTRYVAYDNPRTLVLQKRIEKWGGYECAYYAYPVENQYWKGITDGLYASLVVCQKAGYIVEIDVTLPNKERKQLGTTYFTADFQKALEFMKKWIPVYEDKLEKSLKGGLK